MEFAYCHLKNPQKNKWILMLEADKQNFQSRYVILSVRVFEPVGDSCACYEPVVI